MSAISDQAINRRVTMNTFTKTIATLTIALSSIGAANAASIVPENNSITSNLCATAASGNRAAMHNAIKESGLSKSFVVYNVKCNDESITSFVKNYGKSPEKMNMLLQQGRHKGQVSIHDIASL